MVIRHASMSATAAIIPCVAPAALPVKRSRPAGEQNATRLKKARWRERGRCQCVFAGTGTSAHAALKHGRDAILIELNADYIRLAEQRLAGYLHPAAIKFAADES